MKPFDSIIRTALLPLLLCVPLISGAQSRDEIVSDPRYISGEGTGSTFREADNAALSLITDQIAVAVNSDLTIRQTSGRIGKNRTASSTFESVVNTYSQATLTMCARIVLENGPKRYHILRYISLEELGRIFTGREDKIVEMLKIAEKAERELKIADALKYTYWSGLLLSTLPYPNELHYTSAKDGEVLASAWIPAKINDMLGRITVSFGGYDSGSRILGKLVFLYDGQPVTSLDYTYWDGMDWSTVCSAKDGIGAVEFRAGTSVPSIDVKIEYSYESEAHIDSEVEPVVTSLAPVSYPAAFHNDVDLTGSVPDIRAAITPVERQQVNTGALFEAKAASIEEIDAYRVYRTAIGKVCDAVETGDYASVRTLFDEEGYGVFLGLVAYGKARIMDREHLTFLRFQDRVYCRSVKMDFRFPYSGRNFTEDLVFTFDSGSRLITNITFGLESVSVAGIMSKSQWSDAAKMILVDFLETYKTAFALKRLDYISSIFSDDALIITGRVVKRTVVAENRLIGNGEFVVYNRQTKDEYMRNLSASFASKDFINIRFANTDVVKMGKGEDIYAIQIRQDYVSSNYGDSGYLCLIVDAKNPERPLIHVRTWQPEPDPDFGIYGPGNF